MFMLSNFSKLIKKVLGAIKFKCFEKKFHIETWKNHDAILKSAKTLKANIEKKNPEYINTHTDNPVVSNGYKLLNDVKTKFKDKYLHNKELRILIHVPPFNISPGGYSLFKNLAMSLNYIGVDTHLLEWGENIVNILDNFKPSIFITSDSRLYLDRVDWVSIRKYKKNNILHIGLTASLEEYGNSPLNERLVWANQNDVSFYYSFRTPEYINGRKEYAPFFEEGFTIYNVEFGANPLIYYPVPIENKIITYIFLASRNRDKWERYFNYLKNITIKYPGFVDGPGWSKLSQWAEPSLHRYLYSMAKIGINLHIRDSIEWESELNERTYILAACGIPQLVDNALLLPKRFGPESMFIADTPKEYEDLFEYILENPVEAERRSLNALNDVFNNHTTFHRAEIFVNNLSQLEF